MPTALDGPKNIVLFSDGTGNSASKAFKTNVWRTYQALDLDEPILQQRRQVAFYKDGVGTETFKPLALLGSAFGFGVMRDVRALYTFLCRNYHAGDRIYAFGFSRGAFTIRLLVGLLGKCGIVRSNDENQLFHGVNAAFGAYRRDFLIRASKNRWMIYNHILPPPFYDAGGEIDLRLPCKPLRPDGAFLGLWDTVDAYGMPIEEMKQGIDEWIWPMSLADRCLPKIVEKACHALSLDDERPTFRPVLWDESVQKDKERLEQVWFAGVHANVGGGYPIDDLSYVPLLWMLEKAKEAGLRFIEREVEYFVSMRNVHGTAYDSRAGVAGYYRYGPRSVQKLCDDRKAGVRIVAPVVHESVAERIAGRVVNYAPRSLPADVGLRDPRTRQFATQNIVFLDLAWDTVFWRRIVYFVTLGLTFFLALASFLFPASDDGPCGRQACVIADGQPETWTSTIFGPLVRFTSRVADILPKWAAPWLELFERHPILRAILVGGLAWLFFIQSARLQRCICERSEWAWAGLKGKTAPAFAMQKSDAFIRKVRMSPCLNEFGRWYDGTAVPFVVGILLIVFMLFAAGFLLYFLTFEASISWLEIAVLATLVATVAAYVRNIGFRETLEASLKAAPGKPSKLPERDLFGSESKLTAFRTRASGITLPDGSSVLDAYVGPVLLPNDLYFAVSCGLFLTLFDLWLPAFWSSSGFLVFFAPFGLLYGAADIAEDIVLSKALTTPGLHWRRAAPWLTRAKMLLMTLSLSGCVVFCVMSVAAHFFKPATPSRF